MQQCILRDEAYITQMLNGRVLVWADNTRKSNEQIQPAHSTYNYSFVDDPRSTDFFRVPIPEPQLLRFELKPVCCWLVRYLWALIALTLK